MKISDSGFFTILPSVAKRKTKAASEGVAKGELTFEKEHRRLSQEAKELNALYMELRKMGPNEPSILPQIAEQIRSGNYAVSGKDVIAKLTGENI